MILYYVDITIWSTFTTENLFYSAVPEFFRVARATINENIICVTGKGGDNYRFGAVKSGRIYTK